MLISIVDNISRDVSLPIGPYSVFTGSAVPVTVCGVPRERAGLAVVGCRVSIVNADGVRVTAACQRRCNWCANFAASNFEGYGTVDNGVQVFLVLSDGTNEHIELVASGMLFIKQANSEVRPGGGGSPDYQKKGDIEYLRAYILNGVQHYKRVEIAYDAVMDDWGFNLTGDYVLVDGAFIPYVNQEVS